MLSRIAMPWFYKSWAVCIISASILISLSGAKSDPIGNSMDDDGVFRPPQPTQRQPTPEITIPPDYPRDAKEKQVSGYVEIRFQLGADGSVINPEILKEYPVGFHLGTAALDAFKRWKFKATGIYFKEQWWVYRIDFPGS
jgi:TonB family protein